MGEVSRDKGFSRLELVLLVAFSLCQLLSAATVSTQKLTPKKSTSQKVSETPHAKKRMRTLARTRPRGGAHVRRTSLKRRRYYERFSMSSFAQDVTDGDMIAGEDPVVRKAAIDALGNMNGTDRKSTRLN